MAKKKKLGISKKAKEKLAKRLKPFQEKEIKQQKGKIIAGKKTKEKLDFDLETYEKVEIKPAPRYKTRKTESTILDVNNMIAFNAASEFPRVDTVTLEEQLNRLQAINEKVKQERKRLVKEQISGKASNERIKEIDEIIHGRKEVPLKFTKEYLKKNKVRGIDKNQTYVLIPMDHEIERRRNELQQYLGKDFYYTVDDNFQPYRVKESTLVKMIKDGENVGTYLLGRYRENIEAALLVQQVYVDENKNKFSSNKKKLENHKLFVLEKLLERIRMNEEAIKLGSEKPLMERKKDKDYKTTNGAYPVWVTVVGTQIIIS